MEPRRSLDPKQAREWIGVVRDLALTCVAVFLLVFQAITGVVSWELCSAALACFAGPAALRASVPRVGPKNGDSRD